MIELMVVISIIALLSSIVLASLNSARAKAQSAKFVAELKQLQNALELYRTDNGNYPNEGTDALGVDEPHTDAALGPVLQKYIPKIPHSPNYPSTAILYTYDTSFVAERKTQSHFYFTCDDVPAAKYAIYIQSAFPINNLPTAKLLDENNADNTSEIFSGINYLYCLSVY